MLTTTISAAELESSQLPAIGPLADDSHIHDAVEIFDVRVQKIVFVRGGGLKSFLDGDSLHTIERRSQRLVGFRFDPGSYVRLGRPSLWWIVFKSTIVWRIVRRRIPRTQTCQMSPVR